MEVCSLKLTKSQRPLVKADLFVRFANVIFDEGSSPTTASFRLRHNAFVASVLNNDKEVPAKTPKTVAARVSRILDKANAPMLF